MLSAVLRCYPGVHFEAYFRHQDWVIASQSYITSWKASTIAFEIALYGSADKVVETGKELSRLGAFLQQPCFPLDNTSYQNPHFLPIPGYLPVIALKNSHQIWKESTQTRLVNDSATACAASTEVTSILDSLTHQDFLHGHVADARIKTELKQYLFTLYQEGHSANRGLQASEGSCRLYVSPRNRPTTRRGNDVGT